MTTVYRADTVGSLLRPDYLVRARAQYESGALAPARYKEIEDRAVDQVIAMQEGAGMDVVTDGELRRHTFIDQLLEAVVGLSPDPSGSLLPARPARALDAVRVRLRGPRQRDQRRRAGTQAPPARGGGEPRLALTATSVRPARRWSAGQASCRTAASAPSSGGSDRTSRACRARTRGVRPVRTA